MCNSWRGFKLVASDFCLILIDSGAVVKKLDLGEGSYIIGRSDDADLVISSKDVSRRHAKVTFDGDEFTVEDLDSTNGTFVNGKKITRKNLVTGDEILVGDYKIVLDDGTGVFACPEATEVGRKGQETVIIEKHFSSMRKKLKDNDLKEEFKAIEDVVKKSRKKLATMANEDTLTGLYNRQHFEKISRVEFEQAKRTNRELSVLFIDIDHFKKVNDNYGHDKGDEALRIVAQLIRASCRKSDYVARYGGEEIVVILPKTVSRDAFQVARDINAIISRQTKNVLGFQVTVSIGVATYPEDGSNLKKIVKHADQALYEAKKTGRDRVCKFNDKRD
jgi:diguanylate cyclase (GGDEF)-like protein